jgi:hypothetical protein
VLSDRRSRQRLLRPLADRLDLAGGVHGLDAGQGEAMALANAYRRELAGEDRS